MYKLRGRDLHVAEHLLNDANVGAVLQHQRRYRVAEQVAAAHFADLRSDRVTPHQAGHLLALKRLTKIVQNPTSQASG